MAKSVHEAPRRSLVPLITTFTLMILVAIAFAYAAVQQSYRQNANDPQIQIANNIATALSHGSQASDVIDPSTRDVDPRTALDTFAIITDQDGKVLASNLKMDGSGPAPPKGVLMAATLSHQNRITWQPEKDARIALVVQAYKHENATGYALVGRSLREVEARKDMLLWTAVWAAGVVVAISLLACVLFGRKR